MSPREQFAEAVRLADALMAEEAVARMGRQPLVRWQFLAALAVVLLIAMVSL